MKAGKQLRKIALMHELFGVEYGHTCGECVNFACGQFGGRIRCKCMVYGWTHSEASDWAKSWPACRMFGHEYSGRPVIELREVRQEPETPLEVLSMYDGMSCGRLALDKLGATILRYYATEIDKYAIQATQHNFPDAIQLGDAFQVRRDGWLESNIE